VAVFVRRLVSTVPQAAAQRAQTVSNESVRNAQLESIVSVWLRSDEENATARITQSSLSSEMKARLLPQKE
jgi:uncharacterized Zn finger protein